MATGPGSAPAKAQVKPLICAKQSSQHPATHRDYTCVARRGSEVALAEISLCRHNPANHNTRSSLLRSPNFFCLQPGEGSASAPARISLQTKPAGCTHLACRGRSRRTCLGRMSPGRGAGCCPPPSAAPARWRSPGQGELGLAWRERGKINHIHEGAEKAAA